MAAEAKARHRFGSSDVLIDELFATTQQLRTFVDGRLREHGASVARLRTLRVLALAGGPLRMRDLAEYVGNAPARPPRSSTASNGTAWSNASGTPPTGARSC
ncbi:hypothetical protein [Kitasatospora fiedleri]|uniref:hypothetical protein n=1 Tax=Kitasatospora fiedleri TaxID=2991545 RepID=UPI00249B5C3F|nr:hypothetical protein [Kitasatospora fiedleri]